MGCCKSKNKIWDKNFKETRLSSNRCDAIWEPIHGDEATFGMFPPYPPCARFSIMPGTIRVQVGFAGGTMPDPDMDDVGDHCLALNVEYDPKKLKYEQLLDIFFNYHDIFLFSETPEHQSVIFYRTEGQRELATRAINSEQAKHEHEIVTRIQPFTTFYPADTDHQHFILQNNQELMKALYKNILPHQMAHSHLACRLEGYVAGYGTPEDFDKEVHELYIPEYVADLVRTICSQNQIPEPGADHMNDWG